LFEPGFGLQALGRRDLLFAFQGAGICDMGADTLHHLQPDRKRLRWPNERWNKVMFQISTHEDAAYRPLICDELVRRWQQDHPQAPPLLAAEMYFVIEETLTTGPAEPLAVSLLTRQYDHAEPPTPPAPARDGHAAEGSPAVSP